MKFEDLTTTQLKKIIIYFNNTHAIKDYVGKKKDELLDLINDNLKLKDDGKIYPRHKNPFSFAKSQDKIKRNQSVEKQYLNLSRDLGSKRGKLKNIERQLENVNVAQHGKEFSKTEKKENAKKEKKLKEEIKILREQINLIVEHQLELKKKM
jgi:hypothetical protein